MCDGQKSNVCYGPPGRLVDRPIQHTSRGTRPLVVIRGRFPKTVSNRRSHSTPLARRHGTSHVRVVVVMGLMSGSDLRAKSSRVITYEEFKKALEELAPRRFKGQSKEEALQSIFRLVANKEPANVGVTVRTPPPPLSQH